MPGPIVHFGAGVTCAHGGQAIATSPFPRVLVSGQPVVTTATQYVVAGCPLSGSSGPFDVTGQWLVGAMRVQAGGVPVAVAAGSSLTAATGTPLVPVSVQPRAVAS